MSAVRTVYVNATTAHVGGAVTYIRGLLDALARRPEGGLRYVVLVNADIADQAPAGARAVSVQAVIPHGRRPGLGARLAWDQLKLRRMLRQRDAILFSTANVALFRSPVPQALLVRQSLYFSPDYMQRILPRRHWRARAGERIRRQYLALSMRTADYLIVPSVAMRDAISRSHPELASRLTVIPYATDLPSVPAPTNFGGGGDRPFTFVFPSHYADYKNFRNLLLAARLLVQRGYDFRLRLNAELAGFPRHVSAWYDEDVALLADPALTGVLERAGPQGRRQMIASLQSANAVVMPSFAESFGHPFLEAMQHGLPIAASDLPIGREVAGAAAIYFDPWDPRSIADALARLMDDPMLRGRLRAAGAARIAPRTWDHYIDDFETFCASIT